MRSPFSFIKPSGPPPFDPATLNPDGWYAASFDNSTARHIWLPKAGGGASGTNGNLSDQSGIVIGPTLGANINGAGTAPAVFDGTTQQIASDNALASFITDSVGTVVIFFKSTSLGVAAANGTGDKGMIFDTGNSNLCMAHSSSGVRVCANGFQNTPFIALAVNVFAMAVARWNDNGGAGGNVDCRVSQPSGTTDATHTMLGSFGNNGKLWPGCSHGSTIGLAGGLYEVLTWKTRRSNADLVNLMSYGNSKFAQGLT